MGKRKKYEVAVKATALHFERPGDKGLRYVVTDATTDEFRGRYGYGGPWEAAGLRCVRANGVAIGEADAYYMMGISDCFDPPVAIVCDDNAERAIDTFCDELNWSRVEEPDLSDCDEDSLHYNREGVACDLEQLFIYEVELVQVELAPQAPVLPGGAEARHLLSLLSAARGGDEAARDALADLFRELGEDELAHDVPKALWGIHRACRRLAELHEHAKKHHGGDTWSRVWAERELLAGLGVQLPF